MSTFDDALKALSIISDTAADIYKTDVVEYQNDLDRKSKERENELQRRHAKDLQASSQQHAKELAKDTFNREMMANYPGVELNNEGYFELPGDYDYTKSVAFKEKNVEGVSERLIAAGLYDPTDSFDRMVKKEKAFNIGKIYSSNVYGGTLGNIISVARGGDVSAAFLTTHDLADFETWYKGNLDVNGVITPMGLTQLQDMGLITGDINIQIDQSTGLPYIDESDQALLNATIDGIKNGIQFNREYVDQIKYDEFLTKKRNEKVVFATQLAGSPYANDITKGLAEDSASLGTYVGWTVDQKKPTKKYMNWGGKMGNFVDGVVLIQDYDTGIIPSDRKKDLVNLVTNLTGVSAQGVGAESIGDYIRGLNGTSAPGQGKGDQLLKDLKTIEGGALADKINQIVQKQIAVEKITTVSNTYMESPIELEKGTELKRALSNEGIYSAFQRIRNEEISGLSADKNSPNYNEQFAERVKTLETKMLTLYNNLLKNGEEEKAQELQRWIELEQSTHNLTKLSI